MSKETSETVAAIAARILAMDDTEMARWLDVSEGVLDEKALADIRTLAASCLSQREEEMGDIGWHNLKSSYLRRYRYDSATQELEIDFQNGANWTYIEVPQSIADELGRTASPGGYFHKHIRNLFGGAAIPKLPEDAEAPREKEWERP